MKAADFKTALDTVCQETWDQAIKETPEIAEDMTLQDLKDDVRVEIQVLIALGIIKEKIEL